MPICPHCGAIAPNKLSACQVCGTEYGSAPPSAPELGNEMFWVQIRTEFQCSSCGYFVPLNYLDIDGSVLCVRCGVEQVFDVEAWNVALTASHEVGDLAGPNPEGRFPNPAHSIAASNQYRRIGIDAATATSKQSATSHRHGAVLHRSLIATAAPGFPLCDDCSSPLSVRLSGLQAHTTCAGCGTEAQYETPSAAHSMYHSLLAAVAPEHRTDAADAAENETADGMVLAIRCPNCDGPIEVDGESYFENCGFCHTPVRIREATMRKLVKDPRPLPWWLLYRGPSGKRIALEHHVALKEGTSRGNIEQPPIRESKWRQRIVSLVLPLGALLLVWALGVGERIAGWIDVQVGSLTGQTASPGTRSSPTPERQTPAEISKARVSSSTTVTSSECKCRIGKSTAQLIVDGGAAGDGYQLSLRVNETGAGEITLALSESTAPPSTIAGRELSLGLGCDRDRVYLAWSSRASAYSTGNGSKLWTATLRKPLRGKRVSRGDHLGVRCRSLKVRGGKVRVPLQGKSTAKLRTSDGGGR